MKAGWQHWAILFLAGITTTLPAPPHFLAVQGGSCGDPMRGNGIQSQRGLGGVTLAADGAGNVFIAEIGTTAVRRLAPDGTLTTAAGNGSRGYGGDGGPAVAATFNPITAIAADSTGNLFIAETISPRIRKVDSTGVVSTVAGNGSLNVRGDGGPAVNASLCGPLGLAVDASGNLFISSGTGRFADGFVGGDYRVRKVGTDGRISTVAGMGTPIRGMGGGVEPVPDGGSALNGGIYPLLIAAAGAGNFFFDEGRGSVRRVSPANIITTVAVANTGPVLGLAVDRSGNLFIAQSAAIFKVNAAGVRTPVAGSGARGSAGDGGPATAAQVDVSRNRGGGSPIAVDGNGNVFLAETDKRIRKVTPEGVITTVARIP